VGIQFIAASDGAFAALILPDPGRRRLRFLFGYLGELRAMAWMAVGADGSLYLNHRLSDRNKMISGQGIADGQGGFTDLRLEEREVPAGIVRPKLSYHASGIITRGDERSRSVSIREVTESTLIRQDRYAHPSLFDVVQPPLRQTDIVIPDTAGKPFELQDERPLGSRVFVAPLVDGEAKVPVINDLPIDSQTAVVIPYQHLQRCQDVTYQLQFFLDPPGTAWPEGSFAVVPDLDEPTP
jgi:hypothetical protein